jgi:ricin-type beta-trefoil lectin protein
VRLIRKLSIGRLSALVSAFLLAGAMITGLAGTASADTDGVQTLLFQIQSRYSSGKCLTNAPSGTVTLSTCQSPAIDAQLWQVADGSQAGLIKIMSTSGQCLDVAGAGTANGTPIGLFTCGSQSNQSFAPTFLTGNFYRVRAGHSLGKCLDIKNDVAAEGAPLQLWDCLGAGQNNQHFKFVSA